ncbi:MAG TPA: hypothetical protein VKP61_15090 [Candidatus Acidoferrum sp.]|nr:hypothetical protein [Candidatus Acidoferrum sp.]
MNWILILGGGALLYFAAKGGALGASAQAAAQEVSTVTGGALHAQVKLGNADPNYSAWLQQEIQKLFGTVTGGAAYRQTDLDILTKAINTRTLTGSGGIPGYWKNTPGDCSSASSTGAFGVTQQAGAYAGIGVQGAQLGAQIAGTVGTVANAIPIIGSVISVITAGFSAIFAGHAQAVAREQSTLCGAVPFAQNAMERLDASYKIGTLSGPQIAQALETIYQQFAAGVEPIIQPADESFSDAIAQHHCNAACVYLRELRGIIDAKVLFDY